MQIRTVNGKQTIPSIKLLLIYCICKTMKKSFKCMITDFVSLLNK